MTLTYSPFFLPAAALLFSLLGTFVLLPILRAKGVMDAPNARSNHSVPVPRGGGIAMIGAALLFLAAAGLDLYVIGAAILLALVSFIDDVRPMSVRIRLLAQLVAVALAIHAIPGRVFPAVIPQPLEWIALALAWLWFINLTNFMDGIDGITCVETIMIMLGILAVRVTIPTLPVPLMLDAGIVGAAALGFFVFNRHPARLFMGDVGSIPLGFLTGYLLLCLAAHGQWIAALILPAYYLADATFTLVRRAARGEKVWQAHSEHAYQQAVRGGLTHAQVVTRIFRLDGVLVLLAMLASPHRMAGVALLLVAYLLTFRLISQFTNPAKTDAPVQGRKGFTLIELSIVLVIIGLIIGGILVGQDLIAAATLRAQLSQIEKYNSAINTFRTKYAYLPGDMPPVQAVGFGFTQGTNCVGQAAARDGNGLIDGWAGNPLVQAEGETALFWQDLGTTNLTDWQFFSATAPAITCLANGAAALSGTTLGEYFPSAKIGNGNYLFVYEVNGYNWWCLSAVTATSIGGNLASGTKLSVSQAYNMDKKIDDGLPTTGTVQALYLNNNINNGFTTPLAAPSGNSDTASTCYNSSTTTYSTSVNKGTGLNCALSFRFQ